MHGEIKKFVVTVLVMRHFFIVRGAPKACMDFWDPTAISRDDRPYSTRSRTPRELDHFRHGNPFMTHEIVKGKNEDLRRGH